MLRHDVPGFWEMGSVNESFLSWRKRKVEQYEDLLAVGLILKSL